MNPKPSRKFTSNDIDDTVLIGIIAEQKRGNAQNGGLAERIHSQKQQIRQLSARIEELKGARQLDSVKASIDELQDKQNMESRMLESILEEQQASLHSIGAINSIVPELRRALVNIGYEQKHIIQSLRR